MGDDDCKTTSNGLQSLKLHSDYFSNTGIATTNPTIQTYWDADRLDLGHVGIRPDPYFLSSFVVISGYSNSKRI